MYLTMGEGWSNLIGASLSEPHTSMNAPYPPKIYQDLIKMLSITLGEIMVGF